MNKLFTIDCGEIILREFTIEDVDRIYEITSQPEVNNFCRIGSRQRNND